MYENPYELSTTLNFAEIIKLRDMVEDAGWQYIFERFMDGYALIIIEGDEKVADATIHKSSYGHADGLLEIIGKGVRSMTDSVEGCLTAAEVMERWRGVMA